MEDENSNVDILQIFLNCFMQMILLLFRWNYPLLLVLVPTLYYDRFSFLFLLLCFFFVGSLSLFILYHVCGGETS